IYYLSGLFSACCGLDIYRVLSPVAEASALATIVGATAARIDKLDSKRIGLLTNSKPMATPVLMAVKERLTEKYPQAKFSFHEGRRVASMFAATVEEELDTIK